MNLEQTIRQVQAALGVESDGKAGPMTWAAIRARILRLEESPVAYEVAMHGAQIDERSETHIATLHPRVQPYARALVRKAASQGITIKVISGTRTYEEQAKLYAQGRTATGPKVTNARPGFSNHNFGLAFDIGIFSANRYMEESPAYKAVGALGVELGLDWGGNWKSIQDEPHFQLRPAWAKDKDKTERDMLAELRSRKAMGKDTFESHDHHLR
jgi:peptidoglycan LD-endopeptidase CwlK